MKNVKVVGVGGGALIALNHMIYHLNLPNVDFIAIDIDVQDLIMTNAEKVIRLRKAILNLKVDSEKKPNRALLEARGKILEALKGADVVFLIVAFGGNTGSITSPFVAECIAETGAITVALVSLPFKYENARRIKKAEIGYEKLKSKVNTIFKIPCDKFFYYVKPGGFLDDIFYNVYESMRCTIRNLLEMKDFENRFKKAGEIIFEINEDYLKN